jgi:hypothetical protein
MSIIVAETYVVHAEKSIEFGTLLEEFLKFKKSHYGQPAGMYVEMWEYENLAQLEKIDRRIFSDKGMKKISAAFHELVEPATFSASIWSNVA